MSSSRRLAPVTTRPALLRQWLLDYRFVREVERLEREGRVASRGQLEKDLDMAPGYLTYVRRGKIGIKAVHIADLQRLYNADYKYILFGERLPDEGASVRWLPGKGKQDLRQYEPLVYEYRQPAGWKAGPQPEEYAGHYPPDPTGARWVPHPLAPPDVLKRYEQYKQAHSDLQLELYEGVPEAQPDEQLAVDNAELRAYLSIASNPNQPAQGTRWELFSAKLSALPVFRYPLGHKQAGKQNLRLRRWWARPGLLLTEAELATVWEWLDPKRSSPADKGEAMREEVG